MKNIFIGFLFILLNFNLNLNQSSIDLLPDFVGYIILANGLLELESESSYFLKARPYSIGMAVYTGMVFFLNLVGISHNLSGLGFILGIISLIVLFYISYCVVQGVKEMESSHGTFLNGDKLDSLWRWWVVFSAITYVLLLIPFIAIVCTIISVVVAICFLVSINTSKNLYYNMINRGV